MPGDLGTAIMNNASNQSPRPGSTQTISLYVSPPHSCAYIPEREAVTQFIDPSQAINPRLYSQLVDAGFRRSGEYIYRPRCGACRACIPARVPTALFHLSRSQRRTWRRNRDLEVLSVPAAFREEHFALYRRYIGSRHGGGPEPRAENHGARQRDPSGSVGRGSRR